MAIYHQGPDLANACMNAVPQHGCAQPGGAQGKVNLQDQASQHKSVSFELFCALPQNASSPHG